MNNLIEIYLKYLVNNLDSDLITNSVYPSKDVDGLHFEVTHIL